MIGRFNEEKLHTEMRPRKRYTYWVTGSGTFPFDMLRYDQAWPTDSESASNLSWSYSDRSASPDRHRRSVMLHSYREPTMDRWSSFGWSVGEQAVRKERI
jgi:hypothetical protein